MADATTGGAVEGGTWVNVDDSTEAGMKESRSLAYTRNSDTNHSEVYSSDSILDRFAKCDIYDIGQKLKFTENVGTA